MASQHFVQWTLTERKDWEERHQNHTKPERLELIVATVEGAIGKCREDDNNTLRRLKNVEHFSTVNKTIRSAAQLVRTDHPDWEEIQVHSKTVEHAWFTYELKGHTATEKTDNKHSSWSPAGDFSESNGPRTHFVSATSLKPGDDGCIRLDETKIDFDDTSSNASNSTTMSSIAPSGPPLKFQIDPDATAVFIDLKKSKETKNLVKALKAATDRAQDPETLFRRSSNDLQALVRRIRKTLRIRNISEDGERLSGNAIMDEALRMLQKEAEADNMSPIEKANFIVAQIDGSAALKNWAPLLETMSALKFDQEALGDLPDRELFVGISAFNESVEAIRPTIESLFKHGGNRTRRFHVVIVKDCLKHPSQNDRIDSQPYGVSWESPDKRIALTIINKGLSKYLAKFSSQYFFEKFKMKKRESRKPEFVYQKSCSVLTDTKTIFARDSVDCMFQYIERHPNVIAVTGSQEVYPNKISTDPTNRIIDGVDIGEELHGLRPTWFESIYRGQAMQGFEYIFSYALNTLPFHYLGHLPILPGPFHFYDNEKMEETTILDEFVHTLLKIGEATCVDHLLKLLYLAEDRLMSLLYGAASKYTVAWCAEARFYYKPEPSWLRTMWQRVRWQPGTLAGFVIALCRPKEMNLVGHSWGAPYKFLCLCEVMKIVLCCGSNVIWALVTEYSFRTNPLPVGLLHGTALANIAFPVVWSGWAALIGFEIIGTGNPNQENVWWIITQEQKKQKENGPPKGLVEYNQDKKTLQWHGWKDWKDMFEFILTSFMIFLSLGISAVTMFVNLVGLFLVKDDSSDKIALSFLEPGWGWFQWAAVSAFFALPMLSWIHVGQWDKALKIPAMIISSLGTVLLFFAHHFGAVPLFSIVMCRCLKWRENKVMPSETTTQPSVVVACVPRVDAKDCTPDVHLFKVNIIKNLGVLIVGFALAVYFTGGRECLSFTHTLTGAFNVSNSTNVTLDCYKPGSVDWSIVVQEPDTCCWGACGCSVDDPDDYCQAGADKCVDGCGGQWCLADRIPVVPNATNQTNATNCTETILNEDKNLKKYNDDDTFTTCLLPRLQLYSITFEMLAGVVLSPQLLPIAVGVIAWFFSTLATLVGALGCLRYVESLLEHLVDQVNHKQHIIVENPSDGRDRDLEAGKAL